MATLEISDELDAALQQAADSLGCTKAGLFRNLVTVGLEQHVVKPFDLTDAQIDRIRHSLAQLDRGQGIPGEIVMAKFDRFMAQLESR